MAEASAIVVMPGGAAGISWVFSKDGGKIMENLDDSPEFMAISMEKMMF